jgi:aspartate kinase
MLTVTIWKMFPGQNADPRYFENASLLNQISYREAIELAFMAQRSSTQKHYNPYKRKFLYM